MATYTPVNPGIAGAATALTAVASSDKFTNSGNMILHVKNASGGSINVTIKDQTSAPAGASSHDDDVVVAVANGTEKLFGPFEPERFNDTNGQVTVQYSATSSVTAEVIDAN
jgi:hypothetical protein